MVDSGGACGDDRIVFWSSPANQRFEEWVTLDAASRMLAPTAEKRGLTFHFGFIVVIGIARLRAINTYTDEHHGQYRLHHCCQAAG